MSDDLVAWLLLTSVVAAGTLTAKAVWWAVLRYAVP